MNIHQIYILTCSIRRSSRSEENMHYVETTSFRYPVSKTKFYVRFSWNVVLSVLHMKFLRKIKCRENRHSDSHISLKGIKWFLHGLLTFIRRFQYNLIQDISA